MSAEGQVEHLPLHRVGVLELVDEHDLPPAAHAIGGGRPLAPERVAQLAEQVVVGEDAEPSLAAVHLRAHGAGERDPPPGHRRAVLSRGLQPGLRVVDDPAGDGQRRRVVEHRIVLVEREGPEVEVVDRLLDEVVEVLDQPRAGVGVAGHAEGVEHHRAELVGGRDGRRVEPHQRVDHPPVGHATLLVVVGQQHRHQVGRPVAHSRRTLGRVVAEHPLGLDELGAHALAQLLARRAAEGDDQHLLQPRDALDDVPRHERADRPGLARARARLEEHGAARQRVGDREGLRFGHRGPTFSTPASNGSQTCQAYAGRPASRRTSSLAPGP